MSIAFNAALCDFRGIVAVPWFIFEEKKKFELYTKNVQPKLLHKVTILFQWYTASFFAYSQKLSKIAQGFHIFTQKQSTTNRDNENKKLSTKNGFREWNIILSIASTNTNINCLNTIIHLFRLWFPHITMSKAVKFKKYVQYCCNDFFPLSLIQFYAIKKIIPLHSRYDHS